MGPHALLRKFDRLGIAAEIRSAGVPLDNTRILAADGRTLQRFELDGVERAQFDYGYVAIHRGDLQQILLNELDSPVETGKACAEVEQTDQPIVRFDDGMRIHPDIVIGADGINSNVRDAISPDTNLQTLDTTVYRAIATCELPEQHRAQGVEVWADGTYTGGASIGSDRFYWFATAPAQLETVTNPQELIERIGEYYSNFPSPVPTVINAFDSEDIITTGLMDVPPLDQWSRGAVVLAGDAAHGMLPFAGQGAVQAIEDGIALAAALSRHADPKAAFETYERQRKRRADQIRTESYWLGRLGTTRSTLISRARNCAVNMLPDSIFRRLRHRRLTHTSLPEETNTDQATTI